MSTEFAGLTAVVTGAGSGIGLATAKILKDRGATVYGLDLAEGGMSGIATWVQCDLGDDASVAVAAVEAEAEGEGGSRTVSSSSTNVPPSGYTRRTPLLVATKLMWRKVRIGISAPGASMATPQP